MYVFRRWLRRSKFEWTLKIEKNEILISDQKIGKYQDSEKMKLNLH